jgi:hypothetical protein
MKIIETLKVPIAAVFLLALLSAQALAQADPLPSWKDGPAKSAIVGFVAKVTEKEGAEFVEPVQRIAVFDNDGTLWSEQPMYFQLAFAIDRIKAMAPEHPEWKEAEPFKSVLSGDLKGVAASGEKGLLEIVATTHAGMTTDEFSKTFFQFFQRLRDAGTIVHAAAPRNFGVALVALGIVMLVIGIVYHVQFMLGLRHERDAMHQDGPIYAQSSSRRR